MKGARQLRPSRGSAVIDERAFELLRAEIGDDEGFATFVGVFLDLLPQRLGELAHAIADGETEPWPAAMNLAATSRMLGATALAEHLERLRHEGIDTQSEEAVRIYLRRLFEHGRRLQPALRQRLRALVDRAGGRRGHWGHG
jgi:hypothetical protein